MLKELDVKQENERKKEYLDGYRKCIRQIDRLNEELAEIRINKMFPSVVQDGMPNAHNLSDLSSYAARVDKIERKIVKARYNRIKKKKQIEETIKKVEKEEERTILFLRYIKVLSWNQVMEVTGISPLYKIFRVHGKALNNVIID